MKHTFKCTSATISSECNRQLSVIVEDPEIDEFLEDVAFEDIAGFFKENDLLTHVVENIDAEKILGKIDQKIILGFLKREES